MRQGLSSVSTIRARSSTPSTLSSPSGAGPAGWGRSPRPTATSDRAVILDMGQVVFDGTAQEVLDNKELKAEYLSI